MRHKSRRDTLCLKNFIVILLYLIDYKAIIILRLVIKCYIIIYNAIQRKTFQVI